MHSFKRQMGEFDVLQQNIEYSGVNPLYLGYANPGSENNEEAWMIVKYTYDASSQMITKRFANGKVNFSLKWTLRSSYDYS